MPHEHSRAQGVDLVDLSKTFGQVVAVDRVSLSVEPGEFLTLLGPSGSGKSTTLMLIAGFERPTSGEVRIGDRRVNHVPPYRRDLGVVFQNYALFPHMTVAGNLAFPLEGRGWSRPDIRRRVAEALSRVRLAGLEERYPSQLSGGQQQRVALARALIFDPPVLLMDEPLSALDKKLREQMQLEIKHIQRELGVTVVYVTHDQGEALVMSDRIAVMNHGRVAQVGRPQELYERPRDRFVADFIGETNFITLAVRKMRDTDAEGETDGGLALRVPGAAVAALGTRVTVALRPERVTLMPAKARGDEAMDWHVAVVEEVIYVGEVRKYRLRLRDVMLLAKQQTRADAHDFAEGEEVLVGWHPSDVGLVHGEGGGEGEPSR